MESVQGDERDVILISMTYGPEQMGGRTMQRFGHINSDVGWRRLNVLFTRSKKRMHVFSSMDSSDIIISASSKKGVQSLKAFLEYCETGHLHNIKHTGKAADSDFEITVMRALANHGYECEPQLGVAGYFLDLAVKDPSCPGRFLMAIECDGATYHSAKSTRDRDRLRQEILESLGWHVHRIWSTDWFKNPEAQLQPIVQELERLKKITIPQSADDSLNHGDLVKDILRKDADANINQQDGIEDIELKERLEKFDRDIIMFENPNTDNERRLLRPAMMDALLNHLPCSRAEFRELIPYYLRTETVAKENKYLDRVLEQIAAYS